MDRILFDIRQSTLNDKRKEELVFLACQILSEDPDSTDIQEKIRKTIKAERKSRISCFLQELADFPLFVFVYATLILAVYDHLLVPFLEGKPMDFDLCIDVGFLLQIVLVYSIYKILLTYIATNPKRYRIGFWLVMAALFAVYLMGIYLCSQLDFVIFVIPIVYWIGITLLFCIFSLWEVKKERGKQ